MNKYNNPFALDYRYQQENADKIDWDHPQTKLTEDAERLIKLAIQECINRIQLISKTHKGVGIGDTQTDELIADYFYGKLHWDSSFKKDINYA